MKLQENEKKILLASLERNKLRNQPFDYSEELDRIGEKVLESIRQYKDLKKRIIESKKYDEDLDYLIEKIKKCEQ